MNMRLTVGLLSAGSILFGTGCNGVTLSVRPVATSVPSIVEGPRDPMPVLAACPTNDEGADYGIKIPNASKIDWVRVSADGNLVLASMGEADPSAGLEKLQWSIVAFDLARKRELWRVQLGDRGAIRAGDAFVLPSGVVLDIPHADQVKAAVVMLDRATGAERWERSVSKATTDSDGEPVPWEARVLVADEQNDFVVTSETSTFDTSRQLWNVIDAASARVRQTMTFARDGAVQVPPHVHLTPTDAYVVSSGLARISRDQRRIVWQQGLPSYAVIPSADRTAANAAIAAYDVFAVATLFLGARGALLVGPGHEPREYALFPTSAPVLAGNLACIAGLGLVSCFHQQNGSLAWSRRFPVAHFGELVAKSGAMCASTGGPYAHARQSGTTIEQAPSRGLYCLDAADGGVLHGFTTTLGTSPDGVPLSRDQLKEYDAEAAGRDLAGDADSSPSSQSSPVRALAVVDPGILVAAGDQVVLLSLPTGAVLSTTDLSAIGVIDRLRTAGNLVVASGTRGFAAFDTASGALRWMTPLPLAPPSRMRFSSHDPSSQGAMDGASERTLDAETYWILPQSGALLAWTGGGKITVVGLDDGQVRREVSPGGRVSLDGPPARPWLVVAEEDAIQLHPVGCAVKNTAALDATSSAMPSPWATVEGPPFAMAVAAEALKAAAATLQDCKQEDVSGVGRVILIFAQDGSVLSATIVGAPFEGTPTGACVAERMRAVRVPPFGGRPFSVAKAFLIR